jgi:putative SOS response-associated peptidase YedK
VCGRYAASRDTAAIVEEFGVEQVVEPAPEPSWNVAPTDTVAFVVDRPAEDAGAIARQLRRARWGLVPSWAKDPSIGSRMINARWEQAAEKPAFRRAFAKRRCLVPADGYFEWYATSQRGPGGKPRKQPFYIHRPDGCALGLAGLYEFWRAGPEDDWLVTVTVLTTASAGPLAALHDRMPVVIDPAAYAAWLDPAEPLGPGFAGTLAVDVLTAHPVGTAVNAVRNDGPELVAPLPADGTTEVPDGLPIGGPPS